MGGMDAGEVASRAALTAVMRGAASLPSFPADSAAGPRAGRAGAAGAGPGPGTAGTSPDQAAPQPPPLDPVALVRSAAPVVHAAGQGRQMGTTITLAAVQDGELTLGHIGDTRAYLLRDGALTQLTADHSLVAAMVASGVITPEEAEGHPDSNKVLRSLGSQRELPNGYVDSLEARYGQPTLKLQPGDWLILVSDGVWGSVNDAKIRTVATEALDPPTAARRLIELALEAGAPDNATAVVARCVRMPEA
jgi:protein phosphatase